MIEAFYAQFGEITGGKAQGGHCRVDCSQTHSSVTSSVVRGFDAQPYFTSEQLLPANYFFGAGGSFILKFSKVSTNLLSAGTQSISFRLYSTRIAFDLPLSFFRPFYKQRGEPCKASAGNSVSLP